MREVTENRLLWRDPRTKWIRMKTKTPEKKQKTHEN